MEPVHTSFNKVDVNGAAVLLSANVFRNVLLACGLRTTRRQILKAINCLHMCLSVYNGEEREKQGILQSPSNLSSELSTNLDNVLGRCN